MNKRKSSSANLENKKTIFLETGFVLALAAVLFAFEYKSYDQIIYITEYKSNYQEEELISPIQLKKEEKIPEKPKSFMVLNIVPDDKVTDETDIFDPTIDFEEPMEPWIPTDDIEPEIIESIPDYSVEQKPVYPGGEDAMFAFVARNFKFPRIDLEQGIKGTIYVGFTISKEGLVENVHIKRGIATASNVEALRVVNAMPNWEPGVQNIRKVAVDFVLPIKVSIR